MILGWRPYRMSSATAKRRGVVGVVSMTVVLRGTSAAAAPIQMPRSQGQARSSAEAATLIMLSPWTDCINLHLHGKFTCRSSPSCACRNSAGLVCSQEAWGPLHDHEPQAPLGSRAPKHAAFSPTYLGSRHPQAVTPTHIQATV